jgi:hypothetical protein
MSRFKFIFTTLAFFLAIEVRADDRGGTVKINNNLPSSQPTDDPNSQRSNDSVSDQSLLDEVQLNPLNGAGNWRYAAGLNIAWSVRKDYGARNFRRFEPEAVGYAYSPLPFNRAWLRHGLRMSYSDHQPQMPKSARLEETDWKLSIEEGLIWNWYISPSMTFGYGYDWRNIKVLKSAPVKSSDSRLNSKQTFTWQYLQFGVGLPALYGEYEFQPSIRFQKLSQDTRTTWGFGFEVTKAW